jgi:hypothetical protein
MFFDDLPFSNRYENKSGANIGREYSSAAMNPHNVLAEIENLFRNEPGQ